MKRREWIQAAAFAAAAGFPASVNAEQKPIVLRSGWQNVNIGDIAHSPGVLTVLRDRMPSHPLIWWPVALNDAVEAMIRANFPDLEILKSSVDSDGLPEDPAERKRFLQAGLFIHGSGAGVYIHSTMKACRREGIPYGVFGVTVSSVTDSIRDVLSDAAFIFTRETRSRQNVAEAGIDHAPLEFVPDGTFAMRLNDDTSARAFMNEHQLNEKEFICVVPRLRYTPYHKIRETNWSDEKIQQVESVNEKTKEADHAKLRAAIVRWVRETGLPAVICPEMTYQIDIIKPLVYDPLPDDVIAKTIPRLSYWLPDEASSLYRFAHTVISIECHSPIMAATQGTPFFYVRQPEDTIKGQMYYDIGLSDWVYEIDEIEGEDIADGLMTITADYPAAQAKLAQAMDRVDERFDRAAQVLKRIV